MSNQPIPESIQAAAEKYGSETAIKTSGYYQTDLDREQGFIAGALSPEAEEYWQEQQKAMKWVQPITEDKRPPKHGKDVIVRNLHNGRIIKTQNFGHYHGWGVGMDRDFLWDNTEWLDESNAGNEQGDEKDKEIERLKADTLKILDLAQAELQAMYKRLGFTSSNILQMIDEMIIELTPLPTPPNNQK